MKKKFIPLLAMFPLLATSCGQVLPDNKIKICGNIETYLYKDDNHYLTPSLPEISRNIKIGANFAIFFTNTGCGSCEEFVPIMNEFAATSRMMIYKFDLADNEKEINDFKYAYGDLFFKKDEQNNYIIPTPALALYHDAEVHYVDYDKYMKTDMAFYNYMDKTYKESNIYYTKGDVFKEDFVDCEFAYIYFDFDNVSLMNIYKTKIARHVSLSNRTVIISHYDEGGLVHLKLCGRTNGNAYSRKEFIVTRDTGENVLNEVL